MGLVFVLLIWAVLGTIAATFAGGVLGTLCALFQKRYGQIQKRWVLTFAFLPFASGVYGFLALIAYGVWCETVRGVDFGAGDSFRAKIVNGYEFHAIDTLANCYLVAPDQTQFYEGLQRIGDDQGLIFGEIAGQYFLLDSKTGADLKFQNEDQLRATLQQRGISQAELLPPERFYYLHRFGVIDWVAFGFGVGVPALSFIVLVIAFVRAMRRRRAAVGHLR